MYHFFYRQKTPIGVKSIGRLIKMSITLSINTELMVEVYHLGFDTFALENDPVDFILVKLIVGLTPLGVFCG